LAYANRRAPIRDWYAAYYVTSPVRGKLPARSEFSKYYWTPPEASICSQSRLVSSFVNSFAGCFDYEYARRPLSRYTGDVRTADGGNQRGKPFYAELTENRCRRFDADDGRAPDFPNFSVHHAWPAFRTPSIVWIGIPVVHGPRRDPISVLPTSLTSSAVHRSGPLNVTKSRRTNVTTVSRLLFVYARKSERSFVSRATTILSDEILYVPIRPSSSSGPPPPRWNRNWDVCVAFFPVTGPSIVLPSPPGLPRRLRLTRLIERVRVARVLLYPIRLIVVSAVLVSEKHR